MIHFKVEIERDGSLMASAKGDDGSGGRWGVTTQGRDGYALIGMMIDAAQCYAGRDGVVFEVEWPAEGEWPDVQIVSAWGKG